MDSDYNPCKWYGTACSEKKCDGEGSVRCRIRFRGVIINRLEGEYSRLKSKSSEPSQVHCLSLERNASSSQIASM